MLKEPEIKLFGRKISLPEHGGGSSESSNGGGGCDRCFEDNREDGREEKQEQIDEEVAEGEVCDTTSRGDDDRKTNAPSSESDDNPKNSATTDDDVESGNRRAKSERNPNEKSELKKPDKILACPRCSSMDTKFCYYNNYNVNQPRHFCKSCQRYWTAGGTMRNVPVGAGRRKSKTSNAFHHNLHASNPTVLSFAPVDEPHKNAPPVNGGHNGFRQPHENGFPCIPWPFPWSSAVPPLPAMFPPGHPVPCYLWNVPWMSPAASETAATSPTSTLGKHPRTTAMVEGGEGRISKKSSIVVPKTLRIDDPEEAARSSIWSTLGINYGSVRREGLFKALQPKGDAKKQSTAAAAAAAATTSLMQVNPAALSRSLKFQEAV